mmetsp:Transcript_20924/g.34536  ORF Transcript_20924/g.34536 Transcript_20924/m.34536 type:complete len:80 (+) Transcript_20924:262-501(+)
MIEEKGDLTVLGTIQTRRRMPGQGGCSCLGEGNDNVSFCGASSISIILTYTNTSSNLVYLSFCNPALSISDTARIFSRG